jgi:hypothetical protein
MSVSALCLLAISFSAHTPSLAPKVSLAGVWYKSGDKAKAPWLGLKLCHLGKGDNLVTGSGSSFPVRSFTLPFPTNTNASRLWVRLSREKPGCEVVLVRIGERAVTRGACHWSVLSPSGATIAQGDVELKGKTIHPFSAPEARIVNRGKHRK